MRRYAMVEAALGFRTHSGWAVLVAVGGPAKDPAVLLRQTIELSRKTPRQPFHAAEDRPFHEAEALIRRATDETRALGARAIGSALDTLRASRHKASRGGVLLAAGRPLPGLAEILASHALIHAAEGELFRDAVREGCRAHNLRVRELKEREAFAAASRALGLPASAVEERVQAWGRPLGPPWRQDEKLAALAAWHALAAG